MAHFQRELPRIPGTLTMRIYNALPAGAHAQRHQDGHPLAPLPDPHARIPAVAEEVADVLGPERPLAPGLEIGGQPAHQARDRVLPERPAAQQRRQRALEPPRAAPAQADAEDRLSDPGRPPLVPRLDRKSTRLNSSH